MVSKRSFLHHQNGWNYSKYHFILQAEEEEERRRAEEAAAIRLPEIPLPQSGEKFDLLTSYGDWFAYQIMVIVVPSFPKVVFHEKI